VKCCLCVSSCDHCDSVILWRCTDWFIWYLKNRFCTKTRCDNTTVGMLILQCEVRLFDFCSKLLHKTSIIVIAKLKYVQIRKLVSRAIKWEYLTCLVISSFKMLEPFRNKASHWMCVIGTSRPVPNKRLLQTFWCLCCLSLRPVVDVSCYWYFV
jgi:hypothetical protein